MSLRTPFRLRPLPLLVLPLLLGACRCTSEDTATPSADTDADTDTDTDADTDTDTDTDTASDEVFTLWVYLSINLQVDEDLEEATALLERASAAGLGGVVLADFKLTKLHTGELPDWYADNLQAFLDRAAELDLQVLPAVLPFGYSEGILAADPNLAEGQRVEGSPFVVASDGGSLELASSFPGLENGGFESVSGSQPAGWSWVDEPGVRVNVDSSEAHSGASSLHIAPGHGNARAVQSLDVDPWRTPWPGSRVAATGRSWRATTTRVTVPPRRPASGPGPAVPRAWWARCTPPGTTTTISSRPGPRAGGRRAAARGAARAPR